LININEGTDMSYDATALDGWSNVPNWSAPGSTLPRLENAAPATSVVIDNSAAGGRVVRTAWTAGRDAVSAIMMHTHVYNEYTVEPVIKAATDWVITMPTKRFYVNGTAAVRPFQRPFTGTSPNATSCDDVSLIYYDREEQTPGAIIDFSPTTTNPLALCYEANVLTFTANSGATTISNVLRSVNSANVGLNSGWINGWADLSFPQVAGSAAHTMPAPAGATTVIDVASGTVTTGLGLTYYGLPVIGFAVQSYSTTGLPGVSANVLSNYGGNFNHKYLRDIR
jgi:hypothetical protein